MQSNVSSHGDRKRAQQPKITIKQKEAPSQDVNRVHSKVIDTTPSEAAKFASETEENEMLSLSAYKEATVSAPAPAPEIVIEPPNAVSTNDNAAASESTDQKSKADRKHFGYSSNSSSFSFGPLTSFLAFADSRTNGSNLLSSSTSSSSSDSSPSRVSPDVPSWNAQKKVCPFCFLAPSVS